MKVFEFLSQRMYLNFFSKKKKNEKKFPISNSLPFPLYGYPKHTLKSFPICIKFAYSLLVTIHVVTYQIPHFLNVEIMFITKLTKKF